MTDFYQSNRSVTASYRKKLEDKIALTLRPEELPETHEADLQKVYLEFKNRVVPIVHEETEKHQKELLETNNCHLILLKQTALVDTLVRAALKTAVAYYNHRHQARLNEPEVPVALVARGGYGREEMYFRSDVEIQVVHKPPADDAEAHLAEELIKHFEYLFVFQDIFSTASRSSHSETTGQEQNLTPQNLNEFLSLLEHRFVAGNPVVYTEFKSSIRTALLLHKEDLVKHCHKYESHYQVQNTVFRQEPNVKEDLARLY
ncbi:MAG: hypothetical protein GWM98_06120, partial [Nitrospinaceae bacterium]|nr:hypothetical protein [Nitrospinaceae bacterium]NIR54139.1 hypothetical protein [Nitrospinaceae bacterium]NIS84553.1 hypothetical protein [Nitrospinaceae bacterium]NIT81345.1 hypothetical protein [Nitrospinaceae bacterium]NIU43632.1 hypothetical protein [Nitrospinaceae bacterium]